MIQAIWQLIKQIFCACDNLERIVDVYDDKTYIVDLRCTHCKANVITYKINRKYKFSKNNSTY